MLFLNASTSTTSPCHVLNFKLILHYTLLDVSSLTRESSQTLTVFLHYPTSLFRLIKLQSGPSSGFVISWPSLSWTSNTIQCLSGNLLAKVAPFFGFPNIKWSLINSRLFSPVILLFGILTVHLLTILVFLCSTRAGPPLLRWERLLYLCGSLERIPFVTALVVPDI